MLEALVQIPAKVVDTVRRLSGFDSVVFEEKFVDSGDRERERARRQLIPVPAETPYEQILSCLEIDGAEGIEVWGTKIHDESGR